MRRPSLRGGGLALIGLAGLWASPAPAQQGASLSSSESFRLEAATLGSGGVELSYPGPGAAATLQLSVGGAAPVGATRGPASGVEVELGLWHVPEPTRHALGPAAIAAGIVLGRRAERRFPSRGRTAPGPRHR